MEDGDLTEQKILQNSLDSLSEPFYIAFGIGLCQILDSFVECSLNAQRLWNFPGSLALSIENLHCVLKNFQWSDKALNKAGIGIPSIHIQNLKSGCFKQQLNETMKRSAAIQLNLYQATDIDLDNESEVVSFTSNDIEEQDISLLGLSCSDETKVLNVLNCICSEIKTALSKRIKISSLVNSSITLFHQTDWYDEDDSYAKEKAQQKINTLYKSNFITEGLPSPTEILPGLLKFLNFKNQPRFEDTRVEEIYQLFCSSFEQQNDIKPFISLFEFINIKSYTEAFCESVGSLMNILVSKGRNLTAGNFSKELVFAFNAPPIHILSESFIPEVADTLVSNKQMVFFRKGDTDKAYQLKFKSLSSSLGNYREKVNVNSHLPVCFFNNHNSSSCLF